MKVPYNWEYRQMEPAANLPPFFENIHYSNYNGNGIQLLIPNQTISYPIYKEYIMDITYDPLYSFQRNKTSLDLGSGDFTYALVQWHDWHDPSWKQRLDEPLIFFYHY